MNRREAIQRTSMILGYAISGPALTGILNGCKASPTAAFTPAFLTMEQAVIVEQISEIIIPRTDTPGAKDVGVPMLIDTLLKDVYPEGDRQRFVTNLQAFDDDAKETYGKGFAECSEEERNAHFKKHHDETYKNAEGGYSAAWWNAGSQGSEKPFILEMKELTLLGFFTSQPGATQVLQYNQVPGPYQGCVPLEEVGKQWAT